MSGEEANGESRKADVLFGAIILCHRKKGLANVVELDSKADAIIPADSG